MNTDLMFSSTTNEHFTPPWVLDEVEKLGPIGLDPCAHPKSEASRRARYSIFSHPRAPDQWIPGGKIHCFNDDGLQHDWHRLLVADEIIFWNPPYGRELAKWAAKGAAENCPQVALVPARIDTAWWRKLDPVAWCALSGRLKFWHLPHDWIDSTSGLGAVCSKCALAIDAVTHKHLLELKAIRPTCPNAESVECENSAPFPSAVCLLHAAHLKQRFVEIWSRHGLVYERVR